MRKLLVVVLAMVMVLSLVACGGSNNEKNNAAVQVVMDDLEKAYQEIYSFYEDNGIIEAGETEGLDAMTVAHNEMKASHETLLGDGGYSDEEATTMIELLNLEIINYKEILVGMEEVMAE